MNETSATELFNEMTGLSIRMAIVMIVLGFVALFLRGAAGLGVCVVVSWVMVFSGLPIWLMPSLLRESELLFGEC